MSLFICFSFCETYSTLSSEYSVKWRSTSPNNYGCRVSQANVGGSYGYKSFDITYVINKFKTNPDYTTAFQNRGLLLKAELENNGAVWKKFTSSEGTASRRPYITINYNNLPTDCPEIDSGSVYFIHNQNTHRYMDVRDGSTTPNTPIQQLDFNGSAAQQWKITYLNNGYYKLNSMLAGNRVLGLAYDSGSCEYKTVLMEDCGLSSTQWQIYSRNGTFHFVNRLYNTGLLTVRNSSSPNGAPIVSANDYSACCWEVQELCGDGDYKNVDNHNMSLNDDAYYHCNICKYKVNIHMANFF